MMEPRKEQGVYTGGTNRAATLPAPTHGVWRFGTLFSALVRTGNANPESTGCEGITMS